MPLLVPFFRHKKTATLGGFVSNYVVAMIVNFENYKMKSLKVRDFTPLSWIEKSASGLSSTFP